MAAAKIGAVVAANASSLAFFLGGAIGILAIRSFCSGAQTATAAMAACANEVCAARAALYERAGAGRRYGQDARTPLLTI